MRHRKTAACCTGGGGGGGDDDGDDGAAKDADGEGTDARAFVVGMHVRNGRDFRSQKLTAAEWARLADCAAALPRPLPEEQRVVYVVATESAESRAAASAALGGAVRFYATALPKGHGGGNGSVSREGAPAPLHSATRPCPPPQHAPAVTTRARPRQARAARSSSCSSWH